MKFVKVLKHQMLLILPVVLISLTGCISRYVVLHPIDKEDIINVPAGTSVGGITVDRNGWFLSDKYLEDVAKARVK